MTSPAPGPAATPVEAFLDDCRPLADAQGDVAALVAMVEAVLALADRAERVTSNSWSLNPAKVREAIEVALPGAQGGAGG